MSNYFPFGFVYPVGPNIPYSDATPDLAIETLRARVAFLNACHDCSSLPGEVFAAALKMLQERSAADVKGFWALMQAEFSPAEVAEMASALAPMVADEPPRIDFPNAIALVDCRFVSTLEWQHLRRYSIGGSEAAVVIGLVDENGDQVNGYTQISKFQTRRSLYYEKQATFVEVPNVPQKQQIFDYGHAVEPFVIQKAAKQLGAKQYPEYRMFAHRDYPFITCNPDGILIFPDGSLCLFEAKTATHHKKDDWKDQIPSYYVPQPRQYMEVLDDPRIAGGYIGCCFGAHENDWILHKYEREWLLGKKQIEVEAKFWTDYIAAGVVPPLSGNAGLDMEVLYGYSNAPALQGHSAASYVSGVLPNSCEDLFLEYQKLETQRKLISKAKNEVYNTERGLKSAIAAQIPEGLTVIKKTDEISYRVSFKKSQVEKVQMMDLNQEKPAEARFCSLLATALEEEKSEFTTPKVIIAKQAVKTKKTKGAVV